MKRSRTARLPRCKSLPEAPGRNVLEPLVRAALAEDLGRGIDVTSAATVPADATCTAGIVARNGGVVAGLPIAALVFELIDSRTTFETGACDGERVEPAASVATVRGNARSIFAAERIALNFLCRLSGIATATRSLVESIAHTKARIVDTRKTTPGLRALERYAVRCGGGFNHRFGLDDAILIKDNHRALAGSSLAHAVREARTRSGHMMKIELEVDSLDDLQEALTLPVDAILLDNMSIDDLGRAVAIVKGSVVLEASGGVNLDNAAAIAKTGVDLISCGWITHSAPALDFGLDIARQ